MVDRLRASAVPFKGGHSSLPCPFAVEESTTICMGGGEALSSPHMWCHTLLLDSRFA